MNEERQISSLAGQDDHDERKEINEEMKFSGVYRNK